MRRIRYSHKKLRGFGGALSAARCRTSAHENDKFSYGEDNPSNWSQGFAVLTFTENGTLLEPEFCRVIHNRAWFRGQAVI